MRLARNHSSARPAKSFDDINSVCQLVYNKPIENNDVLCHSVVDIEVYDVEERPPVMEEGTLKQQIERRSEFIFERASELPRTEAISMLSEFMLQAQQLVNDINSSVPSLPEPDKTGRSYPLYPPRSGVDPLRFLEIHWGKWLKRFNPELDRDRLFQDELGHRDRGLLNAIRGKLAYSVKKGEGTESTSDYIAPRQARIDAELDELPKSFRDNLGRLMGAEYTRSRS